MAIIINLVYEDAISEFVMAKLLKSFNGKFEIGISYNGNGYGYIRTKINGFNEASISSTFFVLTDLDNNPCPISLIEDWLKKPRTPNFIFRVAVREVEAWLLADRLGFAEFTGVAIANIPTNPDLEIDPKQTLINISKRSKKRSIKNEIVPINSNAKIGPNYNERLMEYVSNYWDIGRAMEQSESLRRTWICLNEFRYKAPNL